MKTARQQPLTTAVEPLPEILLSLPPTAAAAWPQRSVGGRPAFVASDPPGSQLGSGGGTAHLLLQAWRASGTPSFADWLSAAPRILMHGSGQSRRLPAYAAEGKPLLPLPLLPDVTGQAPDQRLLDAQLQLCYRLFAHAPASARLMIACGDVLLRDDQTLPRIPEADILIVGIRAAPEEACHHGVLFCEPRDDLPLHDFLPKPSPETIRERAASFEVFLDTGIWLFSERALHCLLRLCNCDPEHPTDAVQPFDLFDRFGPALGSHPAQPHRSISHLSAATLPLPHGRFYHFGTNRSLLNSVAELLNPSEGRRSFGQAAQAEQAPVPPVNSLVPDGFPIGPRTWIESSVIPADWRLSHEHCLTAIPDNRWALDLPPGVCLDCVPVRDDPRLCLRIYGFDDAFRGRVDARATTWLGRNFTTWLAWHGLDLESVDLEHSTDIQHAELFPLVDPDDPTTAAILRWMISPEAAGDEAAATAWLKAPRFSAAQLLIEADVVRREATRAALRHRAFTAHTPASWAEPCRRLDLEQVAQAVASGALPAPPPPAANHDLVAIHHAALRNRLDATAPAAQTLLRDEMLQRLALDPATPRRATLDDQIVWGRSPARLDLAGGWADTPPYCMEHGGRVVNLAVNLNGQPPIQVFARVCEEPHLVLRSIDLGISETVTTYEELRQGVTLGSGFAIGRTALQLAGFTPEFHAGRAAPTLEELLRKSFGGGIELNMLAAIPKGSGLGTSSILAATLLGTLSDLCGLGWTYDDLFLRTLVLEQMLGSGGGWQDQVGGLTAGLKRIESRPGLVQRPVVHWLPSALLEDAIRDRRILLYYTGLTRVAHNILGEIVRGIFLNDVRRLALIDEIGFAADFATQAIQRQDWEGLCETIRRSWRLNQRLDSGTNPPAVQTIIDTAGSGLAAAKLLGAGGGGYLLLLAHDEQAATSIQTRLTQSPPNPRARLVTPTISTTGFQVTRS